MELLTQTSKDNALQRQKAITIFSSFKDLRYIELRGKSPAQSYLKNSKAIKKAIPQTESYGILPKGSIFILDIDCKHNSDLTQQVKLFEDFFDCDFSSTLQVRTQSGGLHVYLRLPANYREVFDDLPKGSLRGMTDAIFEQMGRTKEFEIDADVRMPEQNSYVVGPGSILGESQAYTIIPQYDLFGEKKSVSSYEIQEINSASFDRLKSIRKKPRAKTSNARSRTVKFRRNVLKNTSLQLTPASLVKLKKRVENSSATSFHGKRAFVTASLVCCYSIEEIAKVCQELDFDWDSSRNGKISEYELIADLERLASKFDMKRVFHGRYCGKATWFNQEDIETNLKTFKRKLKARKLSKPRENNVRLYKVVDSVRIEKKLKKNHSGRQVSDALKIVNSLVQPIYNCGGDRVLLSRKFAMEKLSLSESQVARAMRILRSSSILKVKDHQRTGASSTYILNPAFFDSAACYELESLRSKYEDEKFIPNFIYDSFTSSFIEVHGTSVHEVNSSLKKMETEVFLNIALEVAQAYTRDEVKVRSTSVDSPDLSPGDYAAVAFIGSWCLLRSLFSSFANDFDATRAPP